jgi:hypothetical protein
MERKMTKNRFFTVLHALLLGTILVCLLVSIFPGSIAMADTVVNFPDPILKEAIWLQLGRTPPAGDIYQSDLVGLTTLVRDHGGIADLTGLEYCTST